MAVAVALLLAGVSCSSGDASTNPNPTATPASGVTEESPALSEQTLPCDQAIDAADTPAQHYTVILEVVALPTSENARTAHQTRTTVEDDAAARLFAKIGLLVHTGEAFELSVPAELRDRMSIGWGSPAARTWDLIVPGCEGESAWLAFSGGFWVRDPDCVPVDVRRGPQVEQVLIGVGAPCPGQDPPPEPTES